MSILCELRRLMRQPTKLEQKKGPVKDIQPLSMKMTQLYPHALHRFRREALAGVTGKQHEIARQLGFPDLYETIPEWVP